METVETERTSEVLKIAEADLRRRLKDLSPRSDAQIEETLRLCESELARRKNSSTYWDSEFAFWHKIISGDIERLRFNQGFEPITIELYPTGSGASPAYLGKTQVGRSHFNVTGRWAQDSAGRKVLRVEVLKAP
jgi:hypothetical protein